MAEPLDPETRQIVARMTAEFEAAFVHGLVSQDLGPLGSLFVMSIGLCEIRRFVQGQNQQTDPQRN